MKKSATRIALVFLALNIFLFAAKIWAGLRFSSLAVLSDAGNSLVDIATSIFIFVAIRVACRPADAEHPFGHARAEPLAAFTVAVLTFVLAFEVVRESVGRILSGAIPQISFVPLVILLGVIFVKFAMFLVARRFPRSPALAAAAADAKMDIVISAFAIGGVAATNFGFPQFDIFAALAIAGWIAFVGWTILRENLAKLMGRCPDDSTIRKIRAELFEFQKEKKISGFKNLRVQFVGTKIQIAVEVAAPRSLPLEKVHNLEESIRRKLRSLENVGEVAVHVEPN